jgi:hypothetical protein
MQTKKFLFIFTLTIFLLLAACSSRAPETLVETLIVTEAVEGENIETVVIEVEAGEEPALYPTAVPSFNPTPPATRRSAGYEPVTAGLVDDNLDWIEYQSYLAEHNYIRANRRDVSERYHIRVTDAFGRGVHDAEVHIFTGQDHVFSGRSDAGGALWFHPNAFSNGTYADAFTVVVQKGSARSQMTYARYTASDWTITLANPPTVRETRLDLLFLIDATGSMADEIDKLKATVGDIADQIDALPQHPDVRYGLVAYRDRGDEFVVRSYHFADLAGFQSRLNELSAAGGGDYPESVNEALYKSVRTIAWRPDAVRMIALIADAPPHLDYGDYPYDASMVDAAGQGIKIFPIGASGLDEQGAFIFRQLAQFTGGKFVFLTYAEASDPGSGPGGETDLDVGGYSVETLDRLIVRLVTEELARLPEPLDDQGNQGGPGLAPIGQYPQAPPVITRQNPVWPLGSPQYDRGEPLSWYTNGDFSAGLTNWSQGHGSNVDDIWSISHIAEIGDHRGIVELARSGAGTDGGTLWLEQSLLMDVSGFERLALSADLRLLGHSLENSGWWCDTYGCAGEYPLRFSIFYRSADGGSYMWSWGFLTRPNSAALPNYSVVPLGEWAHFESPNLLDLTPRPVSIEAVQISAAGWDFHSQVDEAVMVLEAPGG